MFITDDSIDIHEPQIGATVESFNPYPLLGAPSLPCWPRGMPLHVVLNKNNTGDQDSFRTSKGKSSENDAPTANFAVLQSLADLEPDVDAIYRLIRGTPFSFVRPEQISAPSVRACK